MKNPLGKEIYKERKTKRSDKIRGEFFRDQTAIIHSLAFRRLKHKTQVIFSPGNDHVCTRIEHVLHVATISSTICKGLNSNDWHLDDKMAFAIGLGHDLGHAPFGHAGETAINKFFDSKEFTHEINSYRVIEYLEQKGNGLNLTWGVKDGIICHNGEQFEQELFPCDSKKDLDKIKDRKNIPSSYEGCIVRFSDKIAYLGRDIEDAIVAGFIKGKDIKSIFPELANDIYKLNSKIIEILVTDLLENSDKKKNISFSDNGYNLFIRLRDFNYDRIYKHEKIEIYKSYCIKLIEELFDHLLKLFDLYGWEFKKYKKSNLNINKAFGAYLEKMNVLYVKEKATHNKVVTDYVSGMTDSYALECYKEIRLPKKIEFPGRFI